MDIFVATDSAVTRAGPDAANLVRIARLQSRSDVEIVVRSGRLADLLLGLEAHRLDVVLANTAPPRDAATAWVAHTIAGWSGL